MQNEFLIGKALDSGLKRRERPNQDAIGVVEPDDAGKPPLLILADGMGGYYGGEIASGIVVETIRDFYTNSEDPNTDYRNLLIDGIHHAHRAIHDRAENNLSLSQMGSTVATSLLFDRSVVIANVGDSRIYLISEDGNIQQISYDHSMVMDQVRAGLITKEEARQHPNKNVLSMSLNGSREKIDPYFTEVPWKHGDSLLLCSDGLWGPVSESQISNIVSSLDPQEAADKLIKTANMHQGPDNISVIIARNNTEQPDITDDRSNDRLNQNTIDSLSLAENSSERKDSQHAKKIMFVLILIAVIFILWIIFLKGR